MLCSTILDMAVPHTPQYHSWHGSTDPAVSHSHLRGPPLKGEEDPLRSTILDMTVPHNSTILQYHTPTCEARHSRLRNTRSAVSHRGRLRRHLAPAGASPCASVGGREGGRAGGCLSVLRSLSVLGRPQPPARPLGAGQGQPLR